MKQKYIPSHLLCSLAALAFAATGLAQTAAPPPAPRVQAAPPPTTQQIGGTITGHVYCGDTQRPARFADVELLQQSTNTSRGVNYQASEHARTALDGSFIMTGVQPGDYYVSASMSGYISPQAVSRMTQQPIARVPMAHIDAGRSADVVVTMDRGAVVSGRVTYDDGSAVPGVSVRLRPLTTSTTGTNTGGGNQYGGFAGLFAFGSDMGIDETDDRGVYRLTGVAPGKYSVVVTVQTETVGQGRAAGRGGFRGMPPVLNVYAPGTMRKADAQIVEIHGGETADGTDIRVALNGLHTLQGSIESKADGHMLNSGSVSLTDATDSSTTRSGNIDSDGTFRMEYLPPGTYTVTVTGRDQPPDPGRGGNRGPTIRYTAATQTVTVGDSDLTMDPLQATLAASSTSSTSASQ